LTLTPSRASGQSCSVSGSSSCNVTVTLSAGAIPYAAQLTTTATTTSLGTISQTTLPAGTASSTIVTAGPTITANANAAYAVTIAAQSSTWSYTGTFTNPAKPAGHLEYRVGSAGSYTAITTTGASILSGTAATERSAALSFRTTWAWASAKPGTYSLPLTITLTTP